ncbi:hypothetical protein [Legionella yabuuchiae]|uniref:hypothetical protein n=1 Tax=Legionella yabuuchiae TaxID=376727 RepID=UPI0010557695|nr:hypothetical protein [Legionella yabuuchiae]
MATYTVEQYQELQRTSQTLEESVQRLQASNSLKFKILIAAVTVDVFALGLGILSLVKEEQPGLAPSMLGLGVVSLGLSCFGLFHHHKKNESTQTATHPHPSPVSEV